MHKLISRVRKQTLGTHYMPNLVCPQIGQHDRFVVIENILHPFCTSLPALLKIPSDPSIPILVTYGESQTNIRFELYGLECGLTTTANGVRNSRASTITQ
jgi:hypothetical protein